MIRKELTMTPCKKILKRHRNGVLQHAFGGADAVRGAIFIGKIAQGLDVGAIYLRKVQIWI